MWPVQQLSAPPGREPQPVPPHVPQLALQQNRPEAIPLAQVGSPLLGGP
jgi:hypothetical protein